MSYAVDRPLSGASSRPGFTLIELLLALAILLTVGTMVWLTLSASGRSVESLLRRSEYRRAAVELEERIRADLTALFIYDGDDTCAVRLSPDPFAFECCAVFAEGRTADFLWTRPLRVAYRLEREDGNDLAIYRITETLSGPVRRETNRLASGVTRVEWKLFDGNEWRDSWKAEAIEDGRRPVAARVRIEGKNLPENLLIEQWIPVGATFTCRMSRTSQASSGTSL